MHSINHVKIEMRETRPCIHEANLVKNPFSNSLTKNIYHNILIRRYSDKEEKKDETNFNNKLHLSNYLKPNKRLKNQQKNLRLMQK